MPKESAAPESSVHVAPKVVLLPLPNDLNHNYVDAWQAALTLADVRVQFGTTVYGTPDEVTARIVGTMIFTHSGLVKFSREINKIVAMLQDIYDGDPPSLERKTPEELAEIAKKNLG
jgi:hypothetical protein